MAQPELARARELIQTANDNGDLQTAFVPVEAIDPKNAEAWRKVFRAIRDFFSVLAEVFAPLAPVLPYILYAIGIAVILLLLSPVVRLFLTTRFERLWVRDHLKADTPWRPTHASVVALLHDIDALAARGQYDEAVHLLLVRSVADINSFRPDLVQRHYSSREISAHPLLPDGARAAFRQIVHWVEQSYFAGVAVGEAGFVACRQAYVDFVAAEGIA